MISFNGKTYSGTMLSIKNGKIFIDGKQVEDDSKEINIVINGNIDSIDVDSCNTIIVDGYCNSVKTTNGDVEISGNVVGDVTTTNGDVNCQNVGGRVKTTNGNIRHNK